MRHKDFLIWAKKYLPEYCKSSDSFEKVYKILKNPNGDYDSANIWLYSNFTPLIIASGEGSLEVVKYLIVKKSNLYALCSTGGMALHYAAQENHLHVIKYLEKEYNFNIDTVSPKDNTTPLFLAAWKGHLETVKYLYSKGADLNNIDFETGNTPLIQAALSGHYDVVKFLGDNGAKLDTQSKNGTTALIWASDYGFPKITDYLLSKNVDPNIQDTDNATALHAIIGRFPTTYLEREGHDGNENKFVEIQSSIIKSLLDHGAEPNIKAKFYGTAYEITNSLAQNEWIMDVFQPKKQFSHVLKLLDDHTAQKHLQKEKQYPDMELLGEKLKESKLEEKKSESVKQDETSASKSFDDTICFSNQNIDDSSVATIAQFIHEKNDILRILELDNNKITDVGIKIFFETLSRKMRLCDLKLKTLSLEDNQIGDEGAKYLSKIIAANGSLEILNLDNNKISNKGLKYLARAMKHNTHLTELYLDDNEITPAQNTSKYLEQLNQKLEANEANIDTPNETTTDHAEHKNNEPIIVEVVEIRKPSAPPLPPPAPSAPAGSIIDEIAGNCQNTNDPQNEDGIEAAGAIADIPGGYNW